MDGFTGIGTFQKMFEDQRLLNDRNLARILDICWGLENPDKARFDLAALIMYQWFGISYGVAKKYDLFGKPSKFDIDDPTKATLDRYKCLFAACRQGNWEAFESFVVEGLLIPPKLMAILEDICEGKIKQALRDLFMTRFCLPSGETLEAALGKALAFLHVNGQVEPEYLGVLRIASFLPEMSLRSIIVFFS